MLEIFINNTKADLAADISIALSYENPFFSPEGIPTPYSLSFELPRTVSNLALLGNVHRLAATASFSAAMPTKIYFDGLEMLSGVAVVEQITKESIELNFNSTDILATTDKYLHEHDLGRISFGNATLSHVPQEPKWNFHRPMLDCIAFWTNQENFDYPALVAPLMSIKGAQWAVPDSEYVSSNLNQRLARINNYGDSLHLVNEFRLPKILPSVQLQYIMSKIHPALGDAFADSKLRRVMLVTSFHPSYQTSDNLPVWSFDDQTGECYISIADYMPLINTGEFVCETLKLICSSLFVVGGRLVNTSRREILNNTVAVDWSGKIIGTPTIAMRKGEKYVVEYSQTDSDEPIAAEREMTEVSTISWMVLSTAQQSSVDTSLKTMSIKSTGQIFETRINAQLSNDVNVHYDYALIQDRPVATTDQSETTESFSMSINASPVRMVVATDMLTDAAMVPDFSTTGTTKHDYIYCPEIEAPPKTRPDNLIFGSYLGKMTSILHTLLGTSLSYPYISCDNVDDAGQVLGDSLSLELTGATGLVETYHEEFKQWVEQNKRIVKADVLLTSLDIHKLDLRRKIHIDGRNFLLSELSVTLHLRSIATAEATFIEV